MMRWLLASLSLLLFGFSAEPAGTSPCSFSGFMGVGGSPACYSDFTTNGSDWQNVQACKTVNIKFVSNLADDTDFDGTATFYDCPSGVTTLTDACGLPIAYRDSAGTEQTALTGASGRDWLYGVVAQNLIAVVTTASQTSRITLHCR